MVSIQVWQKNVDTYLSNAKQLQKIRLLRAIAAASIVPSFLLIGLLKVSSLFNPSSWHILSKYDILLIGWFPPLYMMIACVSYLTARPPYIHALHHYGYYYSVSYGVNWITMGLLSYLAPHPRPYSKHAMIPQNCRFGIVGSSIVISTSDEALAANRSPAQ